MLHEELTNEAPHDLPPDDRQDFSVLKYGKQLKPAEKDLLESVLWANQDVFAWSRAELGRTHLIEFDIELIPGAKPHARRPFRHSPAEQKAESEEIDKLLQQGLIRPCPNSPWQAPAIMVRRPRKSPTDPLRYRMVCDYRGLNS